MDDFQPHPYLAFWNCAAYVMTKVVRKFAHDVRGRWLRHRSRQDGQESFFEEAVSSSTREKDSATCLSQIDHQPLTPTSVGAGVLGGGFALGISPLVDLILVL